MQEAFISQTPVGPKRAFVGSLVAENLPPHLHTMFALDRGLVGSGFALGCGLVPVYFGLGGVSFGFALG